MFRNILSVILVSCAAISSAKAAKKWRLEIRNIHFPKEATTSNTQGLAYSKSENAIYDSQTTVYADRKEWSIRKSLDGGTTWQTLFVKEVQTHVWSSGGRGIAFSPKGSIFAIGRTEDVDKRSHWLVVRGRNGGKVWQVVDDYTLFPAPGDHYAYHLAVSPKGRICVTGQATDDTTWDKVTESIWTVRCSDNDGETWKAIDEAPDSYSKGIAFDSKGNLYVSGSRLIKNDPKVSGKMLVKFLKAGSKKWKEILLYQHSGQHTGSISAFVDSRDCLFVMGSGWLVTPDDSQLRRWIVRKTCNQGRTWKTLDTFALDPKTYSEAYQMVEDKSGRLFVVGYAMDASKRYHAIVRVSSDRGKTWSTAANELGPEDRGIYGHNITTNGDRVFFSGGWYHEKGRRSLLMELRN